MRIIFENHIDSGISSKGPQQIVPRRVHRAKVHVVPWDVPPGSMYNPRHDWCALVGPGGLVERWSTAAWLGDTILGRPAEKVGDYSHELFGMYSIMRIAFFVALCIAFSLAFNMAFFSRHMFITSYLYTLL